MAKFIFFQNALVKMWVINSIEVKAETKEDAIKILKKHHDSDLNFCEDENIEFVRCENLYDTEEIVSKDENDGKPTVETYDGETDELVVNN